MYSLNFDQEIDIDCWDTGSLDEFQVMLNADGSRWLLVHTPSGAAFDPDPKLFERKAEYSVDEDRHIDIGDVAGLQLTFLPGVCGEEEYIDICGDDEKASPSAYDNDEDVYIDI